MCMKQHPEWGLHEDNTDCLNLYSASGQSEEEERFYMLRPVNKTDHMCQDIKVLTKH